MTKLPEAVYNKIMLFNSHPTADIIRDCIVEAGEGRFIHRGRAEWLIGDTDYDGADDYEVYVLSKCLQHKYQVKYLSRIPCLDAYYQHSNRRILAEAVTRDLLLMYVDDDYGTADDEDGWLLCRTGGAGGTDDDDSDDTDYPWCCLCSRCCLCSWCDRAGGVDVL